jgi:hypothetical protein
MSWHGGHHLSFLRKEERHHSKWNAVTAVSTRTCLPSRSKVRSCVAGYGLWVVGCGLSRLNKGGKGKMKCSKRLEQLV